MSKRVRPDTLSLNKPQSATELLADICKKHRPQGTRLRCATLYVKFRGEFFDLEELRKLAPCLFPESPYVIIIPRPFTDAYTRIQVVYWATADDSQDCVISDRLQNMTVDVAVDGIAIHFKTRAVFSPASYLRPLVENAESFEFYHSQLQPADGNVHQQARQVEDIFTSTAPEKLLPLGMPCLVADTNESPNSPEYA